MAEAQISGTLVTHQRPILAEVLGEATFDVVLAELSEAERESYLGATGVSWIPSEIVDRVIEEAAFAAGRGLEDFHMEITRRTT